FRNRNGQVLERLVLPVIKAQILDRGLDLERACLASIVDGERKPRRSTVRLGRQLIVSQWLLLAALLRSMRTGMCAGHRAGIHRRVPVLKRSCKSPRVSSAADLPIDLLAITITNPDGDAVHQQRHAEQDGSGRGR